MPQDVVGRGNISFGKNKDEMSGNKGKQRRWGVDKRNKGALRDFQNGHFENVVCFFISRNVY